MSLNELEFNMGNTLCPTDSRLRPDIRKLEMGDQDGAASEKARLEEKQRDSRKVRKHKKASEYVPRYKHFTSKELQLNKNSKLKKVEVCDSHNQNRNFNNK
jgi:FMN phosphatase YigB (HAD superfamily)